MHLMILAMGYFIIGVLCAIFTAIIAEGRGRSYGLWFLLGLIFGPLALLIVAAVPKDRTASPSPPIVEPQGPISSLANDLTQLANLRDQGILTDEEFATQKRKLLG